MLIRNKTILAHFVRQAAFHVLLTMIYVLIVKMDGIGTDRTYLVIG